jgi:ABC-type molybdate transport system substrate-binding protein
MKAKLGIVAAFVLAVGAIILLATGGKKDSGGGSAGSAGSAGPAGSAGSAAAGSGTAAPPVAGQVEIQVVYSTEKKDWIEAVTADFATGHPDIKVTLVGKGSFEAGQAIVDGNLKPTVWSPADSGALNLAIDDWQTKNHSDLFATAGDDVPQPLLLTPLVFVAWQDRADVLLKTAGAAISWKAISKAVTSPQGWPAIGGPGKWGFVKLGHTDPTKSNSGLEALYLMSLEFTGKAKLEVEDLLKPDYQDFIKGIEKGVTKFETSTGTFMTDMVRFGPSKYDIAVVYESLAISQLANAEGRWGKLRVYYPATTIWSDHPIGVLQGDWVTPAQAAAAKTYVAFLRARDQQKKALTYGFRPADTSVPIKSAEGQNPFTALAAQGITVDVPPAAESPTAPVVRNLMMMWQRVVQP